MGERERRGLQRLRSVNIQNTYNDYIKYSRVTNAKGTVGGFLWATTIMEKPPRK